MKHAAAALLCIVALAPAIPAGQQGRTPAEIVGALRSSDATYDDWKPILELGRPAVSELKKLLGDADHHVRAQAAVLLYRLGEPAALDAMAQLLGSPDAEARREATTALLAYVGEPMSFDPTASEAERAAALARWNAWWKLNRAAALKRQPMSALYGKVLVSDANSCLCAISPAGRHGVRSGMVFQVHRGKEFVCQVEVVAAPARGAVGRVVSLSARSLPRTGDRVFVLLQ